MKKFILILFLLISLCPLHFAQDNIYTIAGRTKIFTFKNSGDYSAYTLLFVAKASQELSSPRLVQKTLAKTYATPYTTMVCTLNVVDTEDLTADASYYYDIVAYGADTVTIRSGLLNIMSAVQTSFDGTNLPEDGTRVTTVSLENGTALNSVVVWDTTNAYWAPISFTTFQSYLNIGDTSDVAGIIADTATILRGELLSNSDSTEFRTFSDLKYATKTITDSLAEDIAYNKCSVNVKEYGAVGDGLTDDTEAIQSALDSGLPIIVFPPGYTFITDSLDINTAGQTIIATGSTIKLKDNATSENILTIKADSVIIDGGTWDGNRTNGNSRSQWDSWGIYISYVDYCKIRNITVKNVYGMAIYYHGDYNEIYNNNISNYFYGGVFSQDTSYYNSIHNNYCESMNGSKWTTGINLFYNTCVQIKDNVIISTTNPDSINTAGIASFYGHFGVITGNVMKNGKFGITTYSDSTIISNNQILNLLESSLGIEAFGSGIVIQGNRVDQATSGILTSGSDEENSWIISGNIITSSRASSQAIFLWTTANFSDIIISNNYLSAKNGIILKYNTNVNIFNNVLIGTDTTGYAISLYPDVSLEMNLFVTGNNFRGGFLQNLLWYSTTGDTVDNIYTTNNLTDGDDNSLSWNVGGDAVLGDNVINQYKISKDLYIDGNIISNGDSVLTMSDSVSVYATQNDISTFSSTVGTVTSVAAITLGTTGTDLSSTVANGTTTPVITLQVPTASATNRGALSSTDWSTFNNKPDSDAVNGLIGDWADSTASDTSAYTMDEIDSLLALVGKVQTHTITTDSTLAAGLMYGGIFYVTEAQTITLPAVAEGMNAVFITVGNVAVSIDVNGSDLMYLDGTALSDGDKATNTSTTGDMIVFTYFSSVGWYATSGSNDGDRWTDGN